MIKLSSFEGGGYFTPESVVYSPISSGSTGTLLSLPEVEGKVYKIKYLITSASTTQTGISLIADGETVVDQNALYGFNVAPGASGSFYIGSAYDGDIERVNQRIDPFYCKSLSILKNAGTTARALEFRYEVGSFK